MSDSHDDDKAAGPEPSPAKPAHPLDGYSHPLTDDRDVREFHSGKRGFDARYPLDKKYKWGLCYKSGLPMRWHNGGSNHYASGTRCKPCQLWAEGGPMSGCGASCVPLAGTAVIDGSIEHLPDWLLANNRYASLWYPGLPSTCPEDEDYETVGWVPAYFPDWLREEMRRAAAEQPKPDTGEPNKPHMGHNPQTVFFPQQYTAIATTMRSVFLDEYALRLAEMPSEADTETVAVVVRRLARAFREDSELFDASRFFAACGCDSRGFPDYNIGDSDSKY